ncbi:MAG: alpha/beta fold hydrolase [Pirellulaceae bacterium]|nr:alpha/beta fold hydrolase [Pirellulaceae bacterium]
MTTLKSHRVSFAGSQGRQLGGIIDLPETKPIGFILMAHCFTCSKDLKASVRISRGFAELGWGVLRFDFAGLGNSQGDFANTNFRTNRIDLLSAAGFLAASHQAPCLLVGHSFGGATAMSVANELESVQGVVTLATPSETSHLADVLVQLDPRIESEGNGSVTIGGRTFPIARQMLEDFRQYDLTKDIAELRKPLLIFHSPTDGTVGYHHAMRIYSLVLQSNGPDKVRPEASLITLPQSDHLLVNNPRDIPMIVAWISAWGKRLLPFPH